jgi:hypothetical protein
MKSYLTRLTPNFNKWERPSGSEGKCGLPLGPPYEGRTGFGWEEWLLYDFHNPENQLDGYCYGFIQAFHKKNKTIEKIDRLHLYTRVCKEKIGKTYYLGFIDEIEILNQPLKSKSFISKKQNFCLKAKEDLRLEYITDFENDLLEMCNEDIVFNVRFKSKNVHIQNFNFTEREIILPHGWYRFNLYNVNEAPKLLEEINIF